jgi:glycosyltransferase involved in cell wall biosynthesis
MCQRAVGACGASFVAINKHWRDPNVTITFVITRGDSLGGAHTHVLDLATAFIARGHQVTVLLGGEGEVTRELENRSIPFRSLRYLARPIHPLKDLLAIFELWRALVEISPDIVAAHTAKAGLVARCAAALARIPVVFTPHGWAITDRISARQGRLFRTIERLAGRLSARLINVCEYERTLAREFHIAEDAKLAMVHNGIPDIPAEFLAHPQCQPAKLITVARFESPKDYSTLLLALSMLKDHQWTIDLVGDGPLQPEIRRMAQALGLEHRLRFLGARSDVAGLLAQAHIFVLSTRSEALPYAVLEAMRAGLPVVASNVGGISEAVVDGQTGLVAPPKDATALASHLERLITGPELRTDMGCAARTRVLELFTLDKMLEKTIDIYSDVIAQYQTRPALGHRRVLGNRRRVLPIGIRRYGSHPQQ